MTEGSAVVAWGAGVGRGCRKRLTKGRKGNLEDDEHIHYLDYGEQTVPFKYMELIVCQ